MRRRIYPVALMCIAAVLTGCASMSKKDCENADWHAIGYNDGTRGINAANLDTYRQRCGEYKIVPDANAYQKGWTQGIQNYCTSATGYDTGASGLPYRNICPPNVAPAYLSGWRQGVRNYCTPDNALRQGLDGYPYRGVCPSDMANTFQLRYRLGLSIRHARIVHQNIEYRLAQVRQNLSREEDQHHHNDLMERLAHLRHDEEHSEATLTALNACNSADWFDAGLSDGEDGLPFRDSEIASICYSYGSSADTIGYRQGWVQGNSRYCTYASGIYAGQNNLEYHGVCNGPTYMLFWGGYLQGLGLFRAGHFEDHPRPTHQAPRPHDRRMQEFRMRPGTPGNQPHRNQQPSAPARQNARPMPEHRKVLRHQTEMQPEQLKRTPITKKHVPASARKKLERQKKRRWKRRKD